MWVCMCLYVSYMRERERERECLRTFRTGTQIGCAIAVASNVFRPSKKHMLLSASSVPFLSSLLSLSHSHIHHLTCLLTSPGLVLTFNPMETFESAKNAWTSAPAKYTTIGIPYTLTANTPTPTPTLTHTCELTQTHSCTHSNLLNSPSPSFCPPRPSPRSVDDSVKCCLSGCH